MDFREVETENKDIVEEVVADVETAEENVEIESVNESTDSYDDSNDYEDICYVCRRPESIAGKMISIYGGLKVCVDCMQRTMDAMNSSGFGMPPGISFDMNDFMGIPGMLIGVPTVAARRIAACAPSRNFASAALSMAAKPKSMRAPSMVIGNSPKQTR